MDLGIGSRVKHPAYGDGVIIGLEPKVYQVCFTKYGIKPLGKDYKSWDIVEVVESDKALTYDRLEKSLVNILRDWHGIGQLVKISEKWKGGKIILQPHDETLKGKEFSIEDFFHKIVMIRDRIRVMEQRINSSKEMPDSDKVNLQQYITRIYGSLTTFNVLFADKDDHFVGDKSK
ncbi:MAG: hypothetical protein V3V00_06275 [Saprospiraceae bacterium]